jgi:hypothetical protein
MTDDAKSLTIIDVIGVACTDKTFREQFLSSPREILDKLGIDFLPDQDLKVVEVPENTFVISLPPFIELSSPASF